MQPRYERPGVRLGSTFHCYVRRGVFDFAWHYHQEFELTLITRGSGTRYAGTAVERYRPGDLVLLGPDLPHTFASGPQAVDGEAVVVQFRRDFLGPGFFDLPQFHEVNALLARSVRGLRFASDAAGAGRTRALVAALAGLEGAAQTLALLEVLHRLTGCPSAAAMSGPGPGPTPGGPVRERVDAVCRYLQQAHTQPIRQEEVAALVHMSPTSFSRFFRSAMGRTLTAYVTQLRVETACSLLIGTALPVTEVAARSGYRNLANFNRRFRELKGLRPTEYRAAHHRAQPPPPRPAGHGRGHTAGSA